MMDSIYQNSVTDYHLEDIVDLRNASRSVRVESKPFDSSVPYLDILALEQGVQTKFAEPVSAMMQEGELAVVKDGYRSGKVFRAKNGVIGSTFFVLTPKKDICLTEYLYCYLCYRFDDLQNSWRGASVRHLSSNTLKSLIVPVPSLDVQREVSAKFKEIEQLTSAVLQKTAALQDIAVKLSNKVLREKCSELEMAMNNVQRAWLNQLFDK